MTISQAKKEKGVYCCAYSCSNKPIAKKGGLCHKHYARKIRETRPRVARYNQFKNSAIQRGKEFNISFKEFCDFCDKTGYLEKGYRGMNATIDRVKNHLGYSIDNIQIISNRANINKYHTEDEFNDVPF